MSNNRKTVVINLIGSPGTGKSTIASQLFAMMKWKGLSVELVSEYAKELVWEERNETMKNEVYLFGKQHHRLFRLQGKVDYIITDRPLILSCHYNAKYGDASKIYEDFVMHEVNKMNNINIMLHRSKAYDPNGRHQTEEESNQFAVDIQDMLTRLEVDFSVLLAEKQTANIIFETLLK